jgi:predicted GIY-YIG superfamily endonuclease
MPPFSYIYILESERDPNQLYVGVTDDLKQRLEEHNRGNSFHTAKHRPWLIRAAVAVRSRNRAAALERYLKTHSGRIFYRRWL